MTQHVDDLPIDSRTPVTKPVPTGVMAKEPALATGGTISVALWATLAILRSYDIVIPEDVGRNVDILLNLIAGIPAVTGFITRYFVFSPASAQQDNNVAAVTGIAPEVK
jgi:hypothetical protein